MKIHLLSDLHTTKQNPKHINTDCDVMILCGDMGFYYTQSGNIKYTITVNGNHHYYGIEEKPFNRVKIIKDYVFISCTLWTNFWNKELTPLEELIFKQSINDFQHSIYFDIKKCKKCFERDFKFIKTQVNKYKNKKIVICSHFPPSKKAIDKKYKDNHLNPYFVNNLDDFIKENINIKYWFFGHMHNSNDFMIGQCRCVSNPRGYLMKDGKYENKNFKENLIIEI